MYYYYYDTVFLRAFACACPGPAHYILNVITMARGRVLPFLGEL